MISFRTPPGGALARPLLDVYLDADLTIPQTSLVDTGAAGIRLSADLALGAGVALPGAANAADLVIAGVRSQVYRVSHQLAVELDGVVVRWTAAVTFCDPWPHPFGLLGLEGFFDRFDVLVEGRRSRFGLTART